MRWPRARTDIVSVVETRMFIRGQKDLCPDFLLSERHIDPIFQEGRTSNPSVEPRNF